MICYNRSPGGRLGVVGASDWGGSMEWCDCPAGLLRLPYPVELVRIPDS